MKSVLSLALIGSLVGSLLPVAAEDKMEPTAGPIASAVTRAAIRLAADQPSQAADLDWFRLRTLALESLQIDLLPVSDELGIRPSG